MSMNETAVPMAPRLPAGARVGIPPRMMRFEFPDSAPLYPLANSAAATALIAVLSGFFPPGERFFVESVRRYRDQIDDETLRAQVSGFIGQEAIHGHEHERLNEYLAARGFNMKVPDLAVRFGLWFLERLPHRLQLTCTTLMEHFTARLAQLVLTDERLRRHADPEMQKLWEWHALEELEHKAVAYDVLEKIGNKRWQRWLAMPLVALTMGPVLLFSWAWLAFSQRQIWNWSAQRRGLALFFDQRGLATRIWFKMGVFVREGFHPAKHDTQAVVEEARNRFFGPQGELLAEWRNREALSAS